MRSSWLLLAVPAVAAGLGLGMRPAAGGDPGPIDVPAGMVAFFARDDGACPPGYRPATETSGRLIVGATAAESVGKLLGDPLSSLEDRTHVHPFMTQVELPAKALAALDGGNNQGAAAKKYTDAGNTEPTPSGLPFIQLLACARE